LLPVVKFPRFAPFTAASHHVNERGRTLPAASGSPTQLH
jgi:hypothetical protein